MFIVNDPGPWQFYINRPDNKGLSIMEVRDKYLREQLIFEQQLSFIHQQQMMMANASSGGGPLQSSSLEDNTENNYVVNDYVENYFE